MSVFMIRKGEVLHTEAEINVLVSHAKRPVKVTDAMVIDYPNGAANLYICYSDNAIGVFSGYNGKDLMVWANKQKGWPLCVKRGCSSLYPVIFEEALPEKPVRVSRVRPSKEERQTEVVETPHRVRRGK